MKFSTNTPTVSPNTLRNVGITQTQASRDLNAYGGRGGGEQLGALANAAKMGLALQQKVTDGKALEANAEYNRLMSEGTSALMQKKEGEALTITDEYDKLQKNVLAQVNKKYGGYLYGDARESFNAYTMRDDATRRSGVVRYQTAQTDAYRETQYNNQLVDCRNTALEGGGTVESVAGALNRMEAVVDSRFGEYGGEKLVEQKRIAAGQIVGDAVNMAINSGDFAKAEALLSAYKGVLPTNAYIDAKTKLHHQRQIIQNHLTADAIAAQSRGANGKIDLYRAKEMIEAQYGKGSSAGGAKNAEVWDAAKYVEARTGLPAKFVYRQWAHETAYDGKYFNSPLARENNNFGGLTQTEPNGEDNKQPDGNNYYREFGSIREYADAYVDDFINLYEGQENVHDLASFAQFLKNNGYYGASVESYLSGMENVDMETSGELSNYDPETMDKVYRMVAAQEQTERTMEKRAEEERMNAMKNEVAGAGDYASAVAYIESQDADNDTRRRLISYAAYIYHEPGERRGSAEGSGKPYNPQKDIKTLNTFNTAITMGENLTAEKWTNMRAAADNILQNGVLTEEAQAQIEDILNDERTWSKITAALDNGKDIEDIRDVFMASGMSAEMAIIILSRLDDRYL